MEAPWSEFIQEQLKQPYMKEIQSFVKKRREQTEVYPESHLVLNAFKLCPYYDLKVVMIGEQPYGTESDMGLSFSTISHERPKILKEIFQEVIDDIYMPDIIKGDKFGLFKPESLKPFKTNNLSQWAKQGVLLLNTYLTTENGDPHDIWEPFTMNTIYLLNNNKLALTFILIGDKACSFANIINKRHQVVIANNINGSRAFSKSNKLIIDQKKCPIAWHTLS